MKTRFPLLAAIGLVVVWGAMLLAVWLTLDLLRRVIVEVPSTTIILISVFQMVRGLALPCVVGLTAILLHLRQSGGWKMAVILCVACDLAGLSLILPLLALADSLSTMPVATAFSHGSLPGIGSAVVALLLNQILFVLLLRKRREFLVPPQSDGSLLPVK